MYGNGTASCRQPSTAIAFLWEKWMPVPFAATSPHSMWAKPTHNYSMCTLPPPYHNRSTYSDPVLNIIAAIIPANASAQAFLDAVISGNSCQAAQIIMPHLVQPDGTCEDFKPCWSLVYNMASTYLWARTTNEMWDYSKVETYYRKNYQEFLDYWSTYGSPHSAFTSTAVFNNTKHIWAPFVAAKAKMNDDGRRQMLAWPIPNLIRTVADSTFGYPSGGRTGQALMSTFYFGSPLTEINEAWTRGGGSEGDAWNKDVQKWMYSAYHKLLIDENEAKPEDLMIVWSSERESFDPMYNAYVTETILPRDMLFLVVAMGFVFFYITAMKRSIFLSSMALLMIFLTMIPTLALYLVVLRQTYVGMLQLLSLFIIMGIGADNVFVLLDCYEAERDFSRPLEVDLSASWRHASKAMLCTSLTTFFSFMANARSPFPGIYTFGLWCCCLIVVNFIAVNTFYMSVISIFDQHFSRKRLCCLADLPIAEDAPNVQNKAKQEEFPTAPARFFAFKFYPIINKIKVPLVLIWLVLFVTYVAFALKLEPEPNFPKFLPDEDPYGQYTDKLIQHYGAFDNPYRIKVELVIGINKDDPINRAGTDPVKTEDRGTINWVDLAGGDDAAVRHMQNWIVALCDDLSAKSKGISIDDGLQIATSKQVGGQDPVKCPWLELKTWAQSNGWAYPQPNMSGLQEMLGNYLVQPQEDNPVQTNFASWQGFMYWTSDDLKMPKLLRLEVWLDAYSTMLYEQGLSLSDRWASYVEKWRQAAPAALQEGFYFTDKEVLHYFHVQQTITKECYSGIGLSLALSYIVLLFATLNVIVASCAIASIASIVSSVMAFAYWMGWKLGVLEAVIFVMVIGMSVDYVVHLSDAYLSSIHDDRAGRCRFMLGKMGMSVVSGAITTLGAAFFMTFAYITFFSKFGLVIVFTISQSLITALCFFSAMMAFFGPEKTRGTIPVSKVLSKLSGIISKKEPRVVSADSEVL